MSAGGARPALPLEGAADLREDCIVPTPENQTCRECRCYESRVIFGIAACPRIVVMSGVGCRMTVRERQVVIFIGFKIMGRLSFDSLSKKSGVL